MDGDSQGGTAKDFAPLPCRPMFTFKRELVGAEVCPPRVPRLVGARKAVPVGALFGEDACGKERAGDNCRDHMSEMGRFA